MWDGVTYVERSRRPVIHEGFEAAHLVVTNAGPSIVDLMVWREPAPKANDHPDFKMRMPPGDTRSTSGSMIVVGLLQGEDRSRSGELSFAAVAWRVVR